MKRGSLAVPSILAWSSTWTARCWVSILAASWVVLGVPALAGAEEDELQLMNEPATFTDVADAFDTNDPFDLNVTIEFVRTMELGRVQREGRSGTWLDVGDYTHEVNELRFGLDIGIYRDLMIYARLPLILSDDRAIAAAAVSNEPLRDPLGVPLFEIPENRDFRSPSRSGVDRLEVGAAWAILNQFRDPHVPTWVLRLEGQFNIGSPMRACEASAEMASCNSDVGRGVNALKIETRSSYRYEILEPYAGFSVKIEWPGLAGDAFTPGGPLPGYVHVMPPVVAGLAVGTAIVPWEDRAQWQRFAIDARFLFDYFSAGRDYSPVFDALGSSSNAFLATPMPEGRAGNAGAGETAGLAGLNQVAFNGLTDVQERARIGARLAVELRAARYVRFNIGANVFYTPSYVVTQTPPCNTSASDGGDARLRGGCAQGILNPHFRSVIDTPGYRFRMEDMTRVDLTATATAMF